MIGLLLGIDCGQTATKVTLVDAEGEQVATARRPAEVVSTRRGWAERDADGLWRQVADAVREVVAAAGSGSDVSAVGVCGHGDGSYLVDAARRPVRPAVLATDSRASELAETLGRAPAAERMLAVTGQLPFPGSTGVVLAWLAAHEPEAVAASRWTLGCKDWVRLCLTGVAATDRSEASASFADVQTQDWSQEALDLFGVGGLARLLPPIHDSIEVVGEVVPGAADLTGLRPGTPVVAGAHDVDAAAIGMDAIARGRLSAVLGTFSIDQVWADRPVLDPRWRARSFIRPGEWLHVASSSTGTSNLDWALGLFGSSADSARGLGQLEAALSVPVASDDPLYLPFLGGSPTGAGLGGAFVGLRDWHDQAALLRAVAEGVAFHHRTQIDALRSGFDLTGAIRLCGGGTRSRAWTQLMADVLGTEVEITDEAGARGAALLAGAGTGVFTDLYEAMARRSRVRRCHVPASTSIETSGARFERHAAAVGTLASTEPPRHR